MNSSVKQKKSVIQSERNIKLKDYRKKEQQRKIDIRRNIIIGEIITKYFPDVVHFQPQLNKTKNDIEFAKLEIIVSILADDEEYMKLLIDKANKKC